MSPPRQGVFLWEIPNTPELPEPVLLRCRELLSQLLLAAVSGTTEEESDEPRRYSRSTPSVRPMSMSRQSSMQQVRTRLESQRRQYDLRETRSNTRLPARYRDRRGSGAAPALDRSNVQASAGFWPRSVLVESEPC